MPLGSLPSLVLVVVFLISVKSFFSIRSWWPPFLFLLNFLPLSLQGEPIEKLEVTGSYIKRIDIEGPSPIKVIDREMFEVTGSTTIADVLKEDSGFEQVVGNAGYVRFHGQHAGNLLVLLNGLNLPKRDGGFYISTRSLPAAIVEKVEILKEGGSALYGSDAMSGVMNFITRSDIDHGSVTSTFNIPEEGVGTRQRHVATYGKPLSRGHILGMIQFEESEAVNEYDLGSYNKNTKVVPRPVSSGWLFQGDPKEKTFLGEPCGEFTCGADNLQFRQVQIPETNISSLITGNYNFANNMSLSVLGLYNRKKEQVLRSPLSIHWTQKTVRGDQSILPEFLQKGGLKDFLKNTPHGGDSTPIELNYRAVEELGPQERENLEQNYSVQAKLNGDFSQTQTWSWQMLSGFYLLDSQFHMTHGNASQTILRQMLYSGRFDPNLPQGYKSDLAEAMVTPTYKNTTHLITTKFLATGELMELGKGPLSMAIGANSVWSSLNIHNDASLLSGDLLTPPQKNYRGSRNIHSAFIEFSAQPLQNMEVQLASRFDAYSDVGNTWNPKLALSYRPQAKWLLRSSMGTGFRAPGVSDFYRGNTEELYAFTDQVKCHASNYDPSGCARQYYQLNTFVHPNLKPESSIHYNIGSVFEPIKDLSFTIDQWNFEGKDTIARIYPDRYTELESDGRTSELADLGVVIDRDESTGELRSITTPYIINMGRRTLRGVDLEIHWKHSLKHSLWKTAHLKLGSSHSHIFQRKTQTFVFESIKSSPHSWKNTTSASLGWKKHYGRLAARTTSSYPVSKIKGAMTLPRHTVFDITYAYTASWDGKFNIGVKNILDKLPPTDKTRSLVAYGSLSRHMSVFSPFGRRYFVSYSHNF